MNSRMTWLLLLGFAAATAHAEGRVLFSNRILSVDWPVYAAWGGLLSGPDYVAQLFAGRSIDSLNPVGPPVPFRSDVGFGYLDIRKDPARLVRMVPTVEDVPGGMTFIKVVAWNAGSCACETYERLIERRGCGGYIEMGESEVVEMDTGAPDESEPPALMTGVRTFGTFGPLSGPWDVFYAPRQTNGGMRVTYRANVGNPRGRHVLEWSTNLVVWQESVAYTNALDLELVLTNDVPARFYRMRRLCD
jgi:hypothetical protein